MRGCLQELSHSITWLGVTGFDEKKHPHCFTKAWGGSLTSRLTSRCELLVNALFTRLHEFRLSCSRLWHQENMQYEKNVGLLYHRSCIRCYELYICSDLDGIVWVKNAPSELIRAPNSPPAPKRTDKNLFEANFVKLAVVDFFLLPTYSFLPFAWKDVWFGVQAVVWFDVTVGLVVNGPWQSLHCMRCYHV